MMHELRLRSRFVRGYGYPKLSDGVEKEYRIFVYYDQSGNTHSDLYNGYRLGDAPRDWAQMVTVATRYDTGLFAQMVRIDATGYKVIAEVDMLPNGRD